MTIEEQNEINYLYLPFPLDHPPSIPVPIPIPEPEPEPTLPNCTGYIQVEANEYQMLLSNYDIPPMDIASSFVWGFGTYISFWWLGYVIKNARMVIRKL